MDRRLLVLAVGMFALGTDSFVVAGVLPGISHAFSVSVGAAGQMATIYSITFALLSPIIAALAATVARKRLLICGGIVFVLANLGTVVAPTFGLALLTRIIAGVGAATFSPTATGAAAMLVRPEQRGFALSVVVAGLTVSTALGTPLGAVIGGLGDWRWTMAFVAALGALSVAGYCHFLVGSAATSEGHVGETSGASPRCPRRSDTRNHTHRAERHLHGLHLFRRGF